MDGFVALTPLIVLAVILLLGFTGCQLVFPAEGIPTLTLTVRVPSALTVNVAQFRWLRPGSTVVEVSTELVRTEEGADTAVLTQLVTEAEEGSWMVECRMQVAEGADQDSDQIQVTFVVDGETIGGTARFQTTGRPANNNFQILFDGLGGPN